jgi:hypothetical protein
MYLALVHGVRRVAMDCDGAVPGRKRAALASRPDFPTLKRWLRRWNGVRHDEAALRTVLTALATSGTPADVADLVFAAETDRVFADTGHSFDFINKAFECLDLIGWGHAADLIPTVVGQMTAARGADESTEWRQPIDFIARCERACAELLRRFTAAPDKSKWSGHAELARLLLADDPDVIFGALANAAADGASPPDLARSLAYAAALRVAQFGTANEHGDWDTAHHVFTYCNAVHQGLKRIAGDQDAAGFVDAARAILHGTAAIYLIRYLNVPPAHMPEEGDGVLDTLPSTPHEIRALMLDAFNRQHQVELAARLVARHLTLGHPPELIIAALARALLREDAGFHAYQMLEAGVRQFNEWGNTPPGHHILIAVARYLAAHSPTQRAWLQTAEIAVRLSRGDRLHEEA